MPSISCVSLYSKSVSGKALVINVIVIKSSSVFCDFFYPIVYGQAIFGVG